MKTSTKIGIAVGAGVVVGFFVRKYVSEQDTRERLAIAPVFANEAGVVGGLGLAVGTYLLLGTFK